MLNIVRDDANSLSPHFFDLVVIDESHRSIYNTYGEVLKSIDTLLQDQLTAAQRAQVSLWYDHNNDIEALCGNDPHKTPGTYEDIRAINADLEKALKAFCISLFTDVIRLKAVTSRTAKIAAHYEAFVSENNEGKCPYCGFGDIDPNQREAYDHCLPKATYPFSSVNFRNLAPMCNKCNSSYKLQKDPLRHIDPLHKANVGTRRKAFYSYAAVPPGISITMTLSNSDIAKLSKDDITLMLTAPGRDEEIESWKDVFGIEDRYKTKCCAKNDGKAWLQQIIEECANHGQTKDEMIRQVIRAADRAPFDSACFLKKPFILACKAAGVL